MPSSSKLLQSRSAILHIEKSRSRFPNRDGSKGKRNKVNVINVKEETFENHATKNEDGNSEKQERGDKFNGNVQKGKRVDRNPWAKNFQAFDPRGRRRNCLYCGRCLRLGKRDLDFSMCKIADLDCSNFEEDGMKFQPIITVLQLFPHNEHCS